MKKLLCVILAAVMLLSLAACTDISDNSLQKEPSRVTSPTIDQNDPSASTPTDDPSNDPNSPAANDSWDDLVFKIDGQTFSFPGTTSEYTKEGWAILESADGESQEPVIAGLSSGSGYFVNSSSCYFSAVFENPSDNATPAQNCNIIELNFSADCGLDIKFFADIDFTSNMYQTLQTWGNPTDMIPTFESDDGLPIVDIIYRTERNGVSYTCSLLFENDTLSSVTFSREIIASAID